MEGILPGRFGLPWDVSLAVIYFRNKEDVPMKKRILTSSYILPMIVAFIVCWVAVMPVAGNLHDISGGQFNPCSYLGGCGSTAVGNPCSNYKGCSAGNWSKCAGTGTGTCSTQNATNCYPSICGSGCACN
jgi:hypothetical protein